MRILAAALWICTADKIVAPSLVTLILSCPGPAPHDLRILSIPFGPKVVLIMSQSAIAPTNILILANSPDSSWAPGFKVLGAIFPIGSKVAMLVSVLLFYLFYVPM